MAISDSKDGVFDADAPPFAVLDELECQGVLDQLRNKYGLREPDDYLKMSPESRTQMREEYAWALDWFALIQSKETAWRVKALHGLRDRGVSDERTISTLTAALQDPEWNVRTSAVETLVQLEPRNPAIFDLVANLISDPKLLVGSSAATAIETMLERGYSSDEPQVERIAALRGDPRPEVRSAAMRILAKADAATAGSIDAIVAALDDPNEDVREWAISAADHHREAALRAVPRLTEIVRTEEYDGRYSGICALETLGPAGRVAIPVLHDLLTAEPPNLRFRAAYALVLIEPSAADEEVLRVLREAAGSGIPEEERRAADAFSRLECNDV